MIHHTRHIVGRSVRTEGSECLYFGGTSYLGMTADPGFLEILQRNIEKYGSNHGASRWSNLRLNIYEEAEARLAAWTGSEAALTVSSGFLAGQFLAAFFDQQGYRRFYTPGTHAALIQTGKPPLEYEELASQLNDSQRGSGKTGRAVLFTDSIDLSGKLYPDYPALRKLPLERIVLVADDSHGMGLLGANGGGAYRALAGLGAKELLVCGSLGKALGLQGGMILGSKTRLAQLWDTSFFAGASPAPPAYLASLLDAAPLYAERLKAVRAHVQLFEKECHCLGHFQRLQGYPVYGYNEPSLTASLFSSGILLTDFHYPSSHAVPLPGRIVLSAHHTEQDILHLASLLNTYFNC